MWYNYSNIKKVILMNSKLINKSSLVAINVLIIAIVELMGDFFYDSGAIHILAIFFVIVNVFILIKFNALDEPHFKKIFKTFNLSVIFLALVHVLEYLGHNPLVTIEEELEEVIDVAVIAGYLLFFFVILYGLRSVVLSYNKATSTINAMPKMVMLFPVLIVAMIVALFINGSTVLFENEHIVSVFMLSMTVILGIAVIIYANNVIKPLSLLKDFIRMYQIGSVLVIFSALMELLETISMPIPEEQITYFSHFFYYAGLSVMIYGTMKLFDLGGIYKDLLKEMGIVKDESAQNQAIQTQPKVL